jgi:hypothetical protein
VVGFEESFPYPSVVNFSQCLGASCFPQTLVIGENYFTKNALSQFVPLVVVLFGLVEVGSFEAWNCSIDSKSC